MASPSKRCSGFITNLDDVIEEETDFHTEAEVKKVEAEIVRLNGLIKIERFKLRELKRKQTSRTKLTKSEITRYSRQLTLPNIGVEGQIKLKKGKVLIVGAGGLGCPAALYLCGAGVGHIGLVDFDTVDTSNLHRQVGHHECNVGLTKVSSLEHQLMAINPLVQVTPYERRLTPQNACDIVKDFDVVVDCTDNVLSRYLTNDACVLMSKPLVFGSALGYEGQATVYNYLDGPCYRCIFPTPPTPNTVSSCAAGGILGPVTGIIGSVQAIQAIQILLGLKNTLHNRTLILRATNTMVRYVNYKKNPKCSACGFYASIDALINYDEYSGMEAEKDFVLELLKPEERIKPTEFKNEYMNKLDEKNLLIDVREAHEMAICKLDNSENVPIHAFTGRHEDAEKARKTFLDRVIKDKVESIIFVCRRGNDSQLATHKTRQHLDGLFGEGEWNLKLTDIAGGLHAWCDQVDPEFPKY